MTVETECDMSVYDLKRVLQDKEGVPTDQLRLIFAGRQLEDWMTLFDADIHTVSF